MREIFGYKFSGYLNGDKFYGRIGTFQFANC